MFRQRLRAVLFLALFLSLGNPAARAEDAAVIDTRVNLALRQLFEERPGTRDLAAKAHGVLVMPRIVKGGFIVGGRYGEGALRMDVGQGEDGLGRTVAYYSLGGASVGFQAGLQESTQALFFLDESALERFRSSEGWTAGVDAEVTILDQGATLTTSSQVAQQPILAFVFDQDGLMAGASIEGSKYTLIER